MIIPREQVEFDAMTVQLPAMAILPDGTLAMAYKIDDPCPFEPPVGMVYLFHNSKPSHLKGWGQDEAYLRQLMIRFHPWWTPIIQKGEGTDES